MIVGAHYYRYFVRRIVQKHFPRAAALIKRIRHNTIGRRFSTRVRDRARSFLYGYARIYLLSERKIELDKS